MICKMEKKLTKNSRNELPGDMVVVGLGLSLVCLKVGLKVWGLDLILRAHA